MRSLSGFVTSVWVLPEKDALICVKSLPGMFAALWDSNDYFVVDQPCSLGTVGPQRQLSSVPCLWSQSHYPSTQVHPRICSSSCQDSMPLPPLLSRVLDATCVSGLFLVTGKVLWPLRSFSISCRSNCDAVRNRAESRGTQKTSMLSMFPKQQHKLEAAHLGKGACMLKHWNITFAINTRCRLCNVQITYFGLGQEKKCPAFTCSLFCVFHNSWNTNDQLLGCWPRLFLIFHRLWMKVEASVQV